MAKKPFTITADLFDNKYLTGLMDFASAVSPAKSKNEKETREKDKRDIKTGNLGPVVERKSANLNGKLDRDRILVGTSLFGGKPEITENDVKLMSDAGFDFLLNFNSGEYGNRVNDWCQKYDIAVIGYEAAEHTGRDYERMDYDNLNLFEGLATHPATVGDDCCDEPHVSKYRYIDKYMTAYKKAFPDRFIFTNLLPGCAAKSAWGTETYREYVEKYSKEVNSDYISVDIYPFHPSKIMNDVEMAFCLHTYHTIGNTCRRDKKDFWLYLQSQMRWFSHLYAFTTYEMIKWQVYASLCYGCRSLIHVSYNPAWGNDAIGIIDYDGNLTEQYLYVKRVNAEVQKLSPVLKDYRSLGVMFTDSQKNNSHFKLAIKKQKEDNAAQMFYGNPKVEKIESESTALAGFFRNENFGLGLMLVNCQNIYDSEVSQKIKVKLRKEQNVSIYEHGELKEQKSTDLIEVTIGSCDGIFIKID